MPASEDHMVGSFGEAPAPERPWPRLAAARLKRFQLRPFWITMLYFFEKTDVIFVIQKRPRVVFSELFCSKLSQKFGLVRKHYA